MESAFVCGVDRCQHASCAVWQRRDIPRDMLAQDLIVQVTRDFQRAGTAFSCRAEAFFASVPLTEDLLIKLVAHDLERVRGCILETRAHTMPYVWDVSEGRSIQVNEGCDANAAAFLLYLCDCDANGWYVSLPNAAHPLYDTGIYRLMAYRSPNQCTLQLSRLHVSMPSGTTRVAFREFQES